MIAIANDHIGLALKNDIVEMLMEEGLAFKDFGTGEETRVDYPVYAVKAANAVAEGLCSRGILICGTGVGISLAANKVKGIRCVVCSEPLSAIMSKKHNDTNMLALGSRIVGSELGKMIVKSWLNAEFEGERHLIRVNQIIAIENGEFQ